MKETALTTVLLLSLCCALNVQAEANSEMVSGDVILVGSQAAGNMNKPRKGMSKDSVTQEFGQPSKQSPSIGDPPISRWMFDQYTVYFEYNHVIHTVSHHDQP